MAIQATAVWRVRISGDDNNGGAFDPAIIGAGIDYSDQDLAQLSISDLTTSAASATASSTTGGFTSSMIGNAIRIASGTNFTVGTYFITAVTNTNTIVLDRVCSSGVGSSGAAKVGGAFASFLRPFATGLCVAGNAILVRGSGSNEPYDIDYYCIASVGVVPAVSVKAYNGRPKISHPGIMFNGGSLGLHIEGMYFIQTSAGQTAYGVIAGDGARLVDCVLDTGGFDATQVSLASVDRCSIINTGAQAPGVRPAIVFNSVWGSITRTIIKDQRSSGISMAGMINRAVVQGNIIQNCLGDGIVGTKATQYAGEVAVYGNTIYGNGGHGISINSFDCLVTENIIAGHVSAGKYGLYCTGIETAARKYGTCKVTRNNFYGNTNDANFSLSSSDLTIDPLFVGAPSNLTPTNPLLRTLAGVGAS